METCKICFKSMFEKQTLASLFSLNKYVCLECQNKFKRIDNKFKLLGVNVTILYEYNDFLKKLIYQYKGCYDFELKDVFFSNVFLKFKYREYIVIYPPSSNESIKARGFDHMKEIGKTLSNKVETIFYKKLDYKQSDQHYDQRKEISKVIALKDNVILNKNKKYLIIDDIYTSGSTIRCLIRILLSKGISKENIKVLIIAKSI